MSSEYANSLSLQRVPYIAVEVVVASEEEATRDREGDRGDSAEHVVVSVLIEFAVRS